jgi:hypothetical protein
VPVALQPIDKKTVAQTAATPNRSDIPNLNRTAPGVELLAQPTFSERSVAPRVLALSCTPAGTTYQDGLASFP